MSERRLTGIAADVARTAACLSALLLVWFVLVPPVATAAPIIFQSATVTAAGIAGGLQVGEQYLGVRFEVLDEYTTSAIGLHADILDEEGNTRLFGAIVELSGADDFPDSFPLETADVLGSTLFSQPPGQLSATLSAPLIVNLTPGWYALVFGSQAFGATGTGTAPFGFPDIGSPSYVVGLNEYFELDPEFAGIAMFVEGDRATNGVPEPTSLTLLGISLMGIAIRLRQQRNPS